jgi:indole-3-glycerol phosphate synthase
LSKLAEIFAHKRTEVEAARALLPVAELESLTKDLPPCRGFRRALLADAHPVALIAEVKRASPSQGLIRADFDPIAIAKTYEAAGAACLSVLTDERYFQGSPAYLQQVRAAVSIPLLRKDFVCDRYQLLEARVWGADCVLLIVAGLSDSSLSELREEARGLGLDVLVEVHNAEETDVALSLGCDLIGVNNRDLSTFATDLSTSERLIPGIAPHAVAVAESALATFADVERARIAGAKAVLIGTTFCRADDIGAKVREVMGW